MDRPLSHEALDLIRPMVLAKKPWIHLRSTIVKTKPLRYCVFNKTRESFLSFGVAGADTHLGRLKGLLGKLKLNADDGVWLVPSQGVHTIGLLFPVDLIYLDLANRVIHLRESFGSFRIGPILTKCSSVLELPTRTIYASQTQIGDELLICSSEEMEQYLKESQTPIHSTGG
jgi:uncharacterized membrane protein (UPF0127 family)